MTAQGSLGRVDKGHGVGEEGVRAARGHRDPPFVARRPTFMTTYTPPRAGFATIESEAEPPSEAEGVYRGHGYLGRWVVHSLADCPHAVILSIFAEHA